MAWSTAEELSRQRGRKSSRIHGDFPEEVPRGAASCKTCTTIKAFVHTVANSMSGSNYR